MKPKYAIGIRIKSTQKQSQPGSLRIEVLVDYAATIKPSNKVRAIHAVVHDEAYLHPDVMKKVVSRMQLQHTSPIALTPREMEILEYMATPNTYKQIAVQLNVSEETVRSHAKNILEKMKQPNRAQAVLAAMKMRLIKMK
ncbi:MAG TPA: response regulator transcription factor [Anaerolineales bacterium]|nr:response regulator transcription factor [Anaerolineales bacterium]